MKQIVFLSVFLSAFLMLSLLPAIHAKAGDDNFGSSGLYGELGGRGEPDAIGGEFGIWGYATEHLTLRGGLAFLISEDFDDAYGGAILGARYNIGNTFSPFVGFGVFAGYAEEQVPAENDNLDNDDDGLIDEYGEERDFVTGVIASIFPEVGVHIWVNRNSRLTFSGRYHVTTEGRDNDFWIYKFGISLMFD